MQDVSATNLQIDTLQEVRKEKTDTLNYTDVNGLKQGRWETYWNGKIAKREFFRDGKLHGVCENYQGNEVWKTSYSHGIRNGISGLYAPKNSYATFITYWNDGKKVWSVFPWDLNESIIPIKGFLSEVEDTSEVVVHFNSGQLMYSGKIVGNDAVPVLIHTSYYETGELRAVINYDKDTIHVFEKNGKRKLSHTIHDWFLDYPL